LVLRLDAVEIGLLPGQRFFDATGLVGARRIGAGAIDGGKLAFEPRAEGI
jgi:hypothetical protein